MQLCFLTLAPSWSENTRAQRLVFVHNWAAGVTTAQSRQTNTPAAPHQRRMKKSCCIVSVSAKWLKLLLSSRYKRKREAACFCSPSLAQSWVTESHFCLSLTFSCIPVMLSRDQGHDAREQENVLTTIHFFLATKGSQNL